MKPGRWAAIEEAFHAAAELPVGERAGYLDQACGDDAGLRADIVALLESLDLPDDDLRGAVVREASAVLESAGPGRTIGAYRIVKKLGQGGMGSVYLAVRADDQYQKQVAIKLIRAGHEQRASLIRRFLSERQILANLEHPNIARLLDGGVTGDGLPYLVMEHVDGLPIDEFAEARGLRVAQRLELFGGVCAAVRHAHRNMVIHRDLKPSNVLVNQEGVVKLLDFGIAKLAPAIGPSNGPSNRPSLTVTVAAERMLTPDYASPEMIRGEPITTAADVYGLGVILYELLTRTRPFHALSRNLFEVERAIMTNDPARASSVEGGLVRGLDREGRLDLDAIAGKALRREAAERYESVEALAADLQRYRDGFPVQARQGSRRYRVRKFIGRHRLGVAASVLFAVMLIGFGTGMAVLAARAARERDAAQQERSRAEQVSSFLASMFSSADPRQARGEIVTARDLLDRGAQRIVQDLKQQPAVRSQLLQTMGEAYQHLGLLEQSEAVFQQQLQLAQRTSGVKSRPAMGVLSQLADIERMRGKYAGAGEHLRQALAVQRTLEAPEAMAIAHTLNNLALVEQSSGNVREAVRLFREAVRITATHQGQELEGLTMRGNLGAALLETGEPAAAEAELRAVLEERTRRLGRNSPQRLRSMGRLARALFRNGAYAEVLRMHAEAIPLSRKIWGESHPDTLAMRGTRAELWWQLGNQDAARQEIAEVVRLGTGSTGAGHPDVQQWRIQAALFGGDRQVCDAMQAGAQSMALARLLEGCAEVHWNHGDARDALRLANQAIELRRTIQPPGHPDIARLLALAGQALARLGAGRAAGPAARGLLEEAVAIDRKALFRPHLQLAAHLVALGTLIQDRHLVLEGEALRRKIQTETVATMPKP